MDPVTAFQVAAGVAQLAELAIRVGRRVHTFSQEYPELPETLRAIELRLGVLVQVLETVRKEIEIEQREYSNESLHRIETFVDSATRRCSLVERKLNDYLPQSGESTIKIIKRAFKSISDDKEFQKISDALKQDAEFVQLLQIAMLSDKFDSYMNLKESSSNTLRGRTFNNVPSKRVNNFVGQQNIIQRLSDSFNSETTMQQNLVVLCGMGGQGKTQAALEYCRISLSSKTYAGIFWVDASSQTSTQRGFTAIADLLKTPSQVFTDKEAIVPFVKATLSDWSERWLIVFDNYDNPLSFDISEFLPVSPRGFVLVTSRSPHTRRLGQQIQVAGMSEKDALELFFTRSSLDRSSDNITHATSIIQRLGYLPLAIDQAAAYMQEMSAVLPLEEFLSHYETNKEEILGSTPQLWQYYRKAEKEDQIETAASVFTTWNMSFALLRPESPAGSRKVFVLNLLAFFDEKDISEELFAQYYRKLAHDTNPPDYWLADLVDKRGWSSIKFARMMVELSNLSLVSPFEKREDGFLHFSLHPLVRDWIRIRQDMNLTLENISLASAMLCCSIMARMHTNSHDLGFRTFCPLSSETFRITSEQRTFYLAHLAAWRENLAEYSEDMRPAVFKMVNEDDPVMAELSFITFYEYTMLVEDSFFVSEWLWNRCDNKDPDQRWAKLVSGCSSINSLFMQNRPWESVPRAREMVDIWKNDVDFDDVVVITEVTLIHLLGQLGEEEGLEEGEALSRVLVKRLEQERRQCLKVYATTHLASCLGRQRESEKSIEANKLLENLLEESELAGGTAYRQALWQPANWVEIIDGLKDENIQDKLTLEFIDCSSEFYGEDHLKTSFAKVVRGHALLQARRYNEAEDIILASIANVRDGPARSFVVDEAHALLESIARARNRAETVP